jgi:HAD superfamily hydrolase (TIGR01459 family)
VIRIRGIRELVSTFDDFLVDLWGVVHDGERPYEGVLAALEALAAHPDKRVLFLTNTSRTADEVTRTLVDEMRIDRTLFFDVVSSGDVTRNALLARDPAVFHELPPLPRGFHYGDPSFVPWLFELGLPFVDDLAEADLVVASGAPRDAATLEAARMLLAPAAARDVPLVCSNPDRVIPRATGAAIGPGAVADGYAALGGRVFFYGKPHRPIYEEARRRLGDANRRIIAIGDRIETDIRGARAAGLRSVLVAREPMTEPEPEVPDLVIDRFVW